MREGGADTIAQAHASGDSLDPRAGQDEVARGEVHHAVDGGCVECGAFAFDPWAQPAEHCVGIEGKGVRVHGSLRVLERAQHGMVTDRLKTGGERSA